jgi:flagellar biosynthesis GTPase FlhF
MAKVKKELGENAVILKSEKKTTSGGRLGFGRAASFRSDGCLTLAKLK